MKKLNDRLDSYFGDHLLPFVAKEIVVGVTQIIGAMLERLFRMVVGGTFFMIILPILRFTMLEECFRIFVRWIMKRTGHTVYPFRWDGGVEITVLELEK